MRALLPLALLGVAAVAHADRLITIPTGTKIQMNTWRFEGLWEQSRNRSSQYYLGTGITNSFEVELTGEKWEGRRIRNSFDFAYNYVPPIIGFGPGISVGIKDVMGVTRDGRRYYIAITNKEGFADTVHGAVPAEFTFGAYFGSVNRPFDGAMLPFTDYVRLMVEFNGLRINAGAEIRVNKEFSIRGVVDRKDVMIGAQLTLRF
jgi:hypothetical protein